MHRHRYFKRTAVFALLFMLILSIAAPAAVSADNSRKNEKKVVRVGWHEPPYFITDNSGRQSGYSYEYQRKVAAYTGWEYEYVKGSWSELMQKLKKGEIDLLSDVSYTEERTKDMLFTSIPMGTESYYVFVSPDNQEITSDNISSLNGKRIGVAKGSIQKDFFDDWAKKYGIEAQIIELDSTGEDSMHLLGTELDAYVTMDVYGSEMSAVPIVKIGSSDFYFAVKKDRQDLLTELDSALNRIQDENKYYDQQLHDKYLRNSETNRYLSTTEKEWLAKHGEIRVGYQDNYLAFCAKDPETGELTGALKDILDTASSAFENADIKFKAKAYPTASDAIDALKAGEIDCVFPANMTGYDAEVLDLILTPVLMHTEMDAVVRASEKKEFLKKEKITVAVNAGNTNYDLFLAENYPDWERKYFSDTPKALDAVADKKADCVLISNYRFNNISKQCEKLHLTTVFTGVEMDFYFAVNEGDTTLYSILTRITNVIPDSTIHKALTYYSAEDVKIGFLDLIKDNLFIVMSVVAAVLLVIVILLFRSNRAVRKAREEEHLLKDLNKKVYVDALTSVRNKGAFSDCINKLQEIADSGEQLELAIGIFDCNDLKVINDKHGHDKGDIYLKTACRLICKVFDHSPVFRIGGDEFAVILQNDDFSNRDTLIKDFEAERRRICEFAENEWEKVHIAQGFVLYDPMQDASVSDTVRRADKEMYENKRIEKALMKNKK